MTIGERLMGAIRKNPAEERITPDVTRHHPIKRLLSSHFFRAGLPIILTAGVVAVAGKYTLGEGLNSKGKMPIATPTASFHPDRDYALQTTSDSNVIFDRKVTVIMANPKTGESKPIITYFGPSSRFPKGGSYPVLSWELNSPDKPEVNLAQEVKVENTSGGGTQTETQAQGPVQDIRLVCAPGICSYRVDVLDPKDGISEYQPLNLNKDKYSLKTTVNVIATVALQNGSILAITAYGKDQSTYMPLPNGFIMKPAWIVVTDAFSLIPTHTSTFRVGINGVIGTLIESKLVQVDIPEARHPDEVR